MKKTASAVLTLIYCFHGLFIVADANVSNKNVFSVDPFISLPRGSTTILNRQKRQGGGGIIPFRPLFVYRQQQKEKQERLKEIESQKKLREQWLQYQETIKPNHFTYVSNPTHPSALPPPTPSISYSASSAQYSSYHRPASTKPSVQYSSYNYPSSSYYSTYYPSSSSSSYYSTYYPSYYGRYEYDRSPTYDTSSTYNQNYYDGIDGAYDYSYF